MVEKVELYHHHQSVCAAKSRLALDEKGVAWTGHLISLRDSEQHTPEYHAMNPFGLVPVMVHGDVVVCDSNIIKEYVDEVFPGPALSPADAAGRAKMRFWTRQFDEDIHPAIGVLTTSIAYRHVPKHAEQISNQVDLYKKDRKEHSFADGVDTPRCRIAIRRMDMALDHMDQALEGFGPGRVCAGGGPDWVLGDYSLVDVAFAPYITRLDHLQLEAMWDKRPRIAGWYERMKARPAFQSAVIDWLQDDYSWTELMIEKGAAVKAQVLEMITA